MQVEMIGDAIGDRPVGRRAVDAAATRRLGPATMVRGGATLATAGILLALLGHHPYAAVAGFGLVGTGLATVVPNFFSAAGREPTMSESRSIAAVSSFGFAGFLLGPPIIGAIAQATSLATGIATLALLTATIGALAGLLRRT